MTIFWQLHSVKAAAGNIETQPLNPCSIDLQRDALLLWQLPRKTLSKEIYEVHTFTGIEGPWYTIRTYETLRANAKGKLQAALLCYKINVMYKTNV